ncbi:MAG: DUF4157 domain-containing protein [Chitinophagaceae bacterium]
MKMRYRPPQKKPAPKAVAGIHNSQPFIKQVGVTPSPESFFQAQAISPVPQFHNDAQAHELAEGFHAKAFTFNNHIFFNKNQYQPGSYEGGKLIAHEMVHATQHQHIPGIKRKPKDDAEEKVNTKTAWKAHPLFWNDLNKNFPDAGRKLAGSQYDSKTDWLRVDFTEGVVSEKNIGLVSHSAPTIVIGKKYVDEPDEKTRVGYIPAEMAKVDAWRYTNLRIDDADLGADMKAKLAALSWKEMKNVEQQMVARTALTKLSSQAIQYFLAVTRFDKYWVDDSDLGNSAITKKLAGLSIPKLQNWKSEATSFGAANKVSVTNLLALIEKQIGAAVLNTMSTPIQADGKLQLDALDVPEKVVYAVPNATIEVLPDTTGSIKTPGETEVKPNFDTTTSYNYDTTTGIITGFFRKTGNTKIPVTMPANILISIRTTYQPAVSKQDPSGYGRGTTTADQAGGNTTIQFHEGSHGTDYLVGAKAITFPASLQPGTVTKAEYDTMVAAIVQLGAGSIASTDDVGYTQTQYYIDHPDKKPK